MRGERVRWQRRWSRTIRVERGWLIVDLDSSKQNIFGTTRTSGAAAQDHQKEPSIKVRASINLYSFIFFLFSSSLLVNYTKQEAGGERSAQKEAKVVAKIRHAAERMVRSLDMDPTVPDTWYIISRLPSFSTLRVTLAPSYSFLLLVLLQAFHSFLILFIIFRKNLDWPSCTTNINTEGGCLSLRNASLNFSLTLASFIRCQVWSDFLLFFFSRTSLPTSLAFLILDLSRILGWYAEQKEESGELRRACRIRCFGGLQLVSINQTERICSMHPFSAISSPHLLYILTHIQHRKEPPCWRCFTTEV